jgi:hypothetical protein
LFVIPQGSAVVVAVELVSIVASAIAVVCSLPPPHKSVILSEVTHILRVTQSKDLRFAHSSDLLVRGRGKTKNKSRPQSQTAYVFSF